MDPLVQDFLRTYLVGENGTRGAEPGFRKPTEVDPGGASGPLLPVFLEPVDGAPAPGQRKDVENNMTGILSVFYTGGIPTGPLEKFHRRETYDIWVRTANAQLAKQVDNRLWKLLHDKRNWSMAGLTVIESMQWRPLQPVGNGDGIYSYTESFLFELYSDATQ